MNSSRHGSPGFERPVVDVAMDEERHAWSSGGGSNGPRSGWRVVRAPVEQPPTLRLPLIRFEDLANPTKPRR